MNFIDLIGQNIRETAREAVRPFFRNLKEGEVSEKSEDDYVTAADLACESLLAEKLSKIFPGVPLIGEEGVFSGKVSLSPESLPDAFFVCDPIDGTRNFKNGSERYSIMLAFVESGKVMNAWIYAPEYDLMADASSGEGTRLNGKNIVLSNRPLDTGDGISAFGYLEGEEMMERMSRLIPGLVPKSAFGFGMDCMDVVMGKSRGIVQSLSKTWDVLPGQLIMREAGMQTGRFDPQRNELLAENQWTFALPSHEDVERLLPLEALKKDEEQYPDPFGVGQKY